MLRHFLRSFVQQIRPDASTDTLIKIALFPDDDAARLWHRWRSSHRIEDCSWPQHKLLVLISERLARVAPDCQQIRHLDGLAKANWAKSKLRLHHAGMAIERLQQAGIDVLLLKGAASEALAEIHNRRRVTSDLDIMVPREQLEPALHMLAAQGLGCTGGPAAALRRCGYHPGINLSNPAGTLDVDIHHQPVHFPFLPGPVLNRIWRRARPAQLFDHDVLVPSAADHLTFAVVHGMRRFVPSHLTSGLWAVDLARWAAQDRPDWSGLVESAFDVRGSLALYAALGYVREELGVDVPDSVFDQLLEDRIDVAQYVSFFAQAPSIGVRGKLALPLREALLLLTQQMFHRSARNSQAGEAASTDAPSR